MSFADYLSPAVHEAFPEVGQFESVLREDFGVGRVVVPHYRLVHPDAVTRRNPHWQERLRDPRTGLFLPAKLAMHAVVLETVDQLLGADELPAAIQSLQLPADLAGDFQVLDAAAIDPAVDPSERHAATNIVTVAELFHDRYFQPRRYPYLATALRGVDIADHGMIGVHVDQTDALKVPGMHLDNADRDHITTTLASTTRPSVAPQGRVDIGVRRLGDNDVMLVAENWDEDSVADVAPPGKVAVLGPLDVHSRSYGRHAELYHQYSQEGRRIPVERIFAAAITDLTS